MQTWECPNCGEINAWDAEVCEWCGYEPDEIGYAAEDIIDDLFE